MIWAIALVPGIPLAAFIGWFVWASVKGKLPPHHIESFGRGPRPPC